MKHIPQLSDPQTVSKGFLENFVIQSTNLSFDPLVTKSIEVTIPELVIHPCQRTADLWALLAWGTTPKDIPNTNIDPFAPSSGATSLRFDGNAEYTFSEGESMRRSSIKLYDNTRLTTLVAPISYIDGDSVSINEGSETSFIPRPILQSINEGNSVNESRIPRSFSKIVTVIKEDTNNLSKISSGVLKSTKEDDSSDTSKIQQRLIIIEESNTDVSLIPKANNVVIINESTDSVSYINSRLVSTNEDTMDASRIVPPFISSIIEENLNNSKITERLVIINEDSQVSSIEFNFTTDKIVTINED